MAIKKIRNGFFEIRNGYKQIIAKIPLKNTSGALVHGHMSLITVSHADTHKGGSTTVEVLAHILTLLASMIGSLSRFHIHVQLDNTSSSNKNNIVLAFLGFMTLMNKFCTFTANFL